MESAVYAVGFGVLKSYCIAADFNVIKPHANFQDFPVDLCGGYLRQPVVCSRGGRRGPSQIARGVARENGGIERAEAVQYYPHAR